jgi:hypothetical protein
MRKLNKGVRQRVQPVRCLPIFDIDIQMPALVTRLQLVLFSEI